MPERARLEERLKQVHADLEKASRSFDASVNTVADLLGSKDAKRVSAAKEAMYLWSDAVRTLSEEERALQRRLDYLTSRELTLGAAKAVRSASRAAWAAFWVTVFAMIGWTTATFLTTLTHVVR